MKYFYIVLILIVFSSSQLFACDVNLISLISGKRPTDAFTGNVSNLIKVTQELGQNITDKEKSSVALKKLMLAWVEFDTKYYQTPPEWAKKDKKWKVKIKAVADQIGIVTKLLKSDKRIKAHDETLSISRKLTNLLEYLPMDPEEQSLMVFPLKFDMMDKAFKEKNIVFLGKLISELVAEKNKLRSVVGSSSIKLTDEFADRIESLESSYKNDAGKFGKNLKLTMVFAEDAFNKMSASIRGVKSKEKDDAN